MFLLLLFIFERERAEEEQGAREGNTESEAGSRLWAVSTEPNAGFELRNYEGVTWAKVGHLPSWATQAPQVWLF